MTWEVIGALALFAFVSSVTPGPNNMMLLASGANFGFKRTIPHMLGVGIGFTLMVFLVGIGIFKLFDTYPVLHSGLKIISIIYLIYLAWKIATTSSPTSEDQSQAKPISFIQAAAFQWVNPKAWTMALTAITLYAPQQNLSSVILVALIFGVINLPSVGSWVVLGENIKRWLTNQDKVRVFNYSMAGLLICSIIPSLG